MFEPEEHPARDAQIERQQIEGRNAVAEALRAGQTPDKLYVVSGAEGLGKLIALAKASGVVVAERSRMQMDAVSITKKHQGVIAVMPARAYADFNDIFEKAARSGRPPLVVVCDGIEDGRNLGAICRTAEAAGAHGVVIAKHRSASLTAWVDKAAAGALEYLPVVRASNISSALRELKKRGLWIYGAEANGGTSVFETDLSGYSALVLGSEKSGLSRLVREHCDFFVSIPMFGQMSSLNVSAAAAVLLYQAARVR